MTGTHNHWAESVLALPRPIKRLLVLSLDAGQCVLAVWLAFYLRLEVFVPLTRPVMWAALGSVVLMLPIFTLAGLYRAIFRYSGLLAMMAVGRAILLYGVLYAAVFTFYQVKGVPRSIGLIQPVVLFLLVGASRAAARVWLGGLYDQQIRRAALPRALIYGAGSAGRQLASAITNSLEIRVVGFVDDDDRMHGHILNGLPVHNPADLIEVINSSEITDVLLALPNASRQRRNDILNTLKPHKVAVRTLPDLSDIATGKVRLSDVRELDLDDLLGREPVRPNKLLLNANTCGKTVMVTGAGGSIGGELCRQILKTQPLQLLLVEMSEFALYQIHQELVELLAEGLADRQSTKAAAQGEPAFEPDKALRVAGVEVVPLLASVCDEVRMHEIMDTWKPHTVYHAAAYKHVPLVEHNLAEGVRNNVWGTRVCAEAAMRHSVHNFVLGEYGQSCAPNQYHGCD